MGRRVHSVDAPQCDDASTAITIEAVYFPRPDGTPFVLEFSMKGAGGEFVVKRTRAIQEEWASGTLERLPGNPMQDALIADLELRAGEVLDRVGLIGA